MNRTVLDRRIKNIVNRELDRRGLCPGAVVEIKRPYIPKLPPNHNEPWAEEDEEYLASKVVSLLESAGEDLGRTPRAIYERLRLRGLRGIRGFLRGYGQEVPKRP